MTAPSALDVASDVGNPSAQVGAESDRRENQVVPREAATLIERLARDLDRFDPFEALRIIELAGGARPPVFKGAVTRRHLATPVGRNPASGDVEVGFVGLIGPLGVLPPTYTDLAIQARKQRNHAFAAFFDIFVSRLAALFTRAAEKYQLPALVARHGPSGADAVTAALFATIGIGLPALRHRLPTPDYRLLPYAGLLARDVRSAVGLEVLLTHFLDAPVKLTSFQRRWLPVAPQEQTRMSADEPQFSRLGVDAVAGSGIWDASSTFRVVIGPVGYAEFESFAPGGRRLRELAEIVRMYIDPGLDFDLQIILRKEEAPECRLDGARPAALGWNTWVRQLPLERDADQSIVTPP